MAAAAGEKTEKATPQRLRRARGEGQVAKTPDLSAWATVAVGATLVPGVIRAAQARLEGLLLQVTGVIENPDPLVATRIMAEGLRDSVLLVAPIAGAATLAAIVAGAVQGGIHPAWPSVRPKLSRLNPIDGFKQRYGLMAWWQGAQTALKTAALVYVTYRAVQQAIPVLVGGGALPLSSSLQIVHSSIVDLVVVSVGIGTVLAVADYMIKMRKTAKDLRMTKQEVKDENKRTEGDPMLKAARRSRAMQMSRNRMMSEVTHADAVLVNPTHVAVAVRYDPAKGAPRVVAKGSGHLAARIREKAREHGVPLVADVPLARALYAACKVGQEIPMELYGPVAQVLAFLMNLKRTRRGVGEDPLVIPAPRGGQRVRS